MPLPAPSHITRLEGRTVLKLSGADRVRFLQGLVTADIEALQPAQAAWAACLTPQGRWQADFFAIPDPDDTCLLLDCATEQAEALRTQLMRFRLRSDVQMELTALPVYAAWGNRPEATLLENAISVADPRLPAAGWRLIDPPATTEQTATQLDYDLHRLALGLPDGVQDCEQGRTLAAEANMDLLGGIAWKKGCYMGQEVTARMHYRTLLKRRLVPIAATAPLPAPGTAILHNGQEVGTLRSSRDHIGLALLKVDMADKPLTCLDHNVVARPPAWLLPALGTPPEPSATTPDKP
ncbi:MAG: folate-binding protein YgfZ [Acetobacter fabarum]|jgi:folate-binding protein YgfZ|uniref:Aminomethyltransferase n=1 Tax=Acetobacter fabarum TaxID=483199 RepID=A0A269Y0R7_9PROT|nr:MULTISPECIES: folate-binding protein YgfZ [Acetobacter]MCH4026244.1 folate-binding protein YgfZ [Acetobacter fabarum]MCH4055241.1 folate-binding protein YgfZ [Acetobacter fabarum]MCH4085894.1 folate-binding protein YgfZ [Acetobacter fabarum]MCH4127514.1 folate-binding protein YgfZ [Acetobacter fabarum]MCH4136863.1 folate-binding protein YgfZ [Acetobacter fabarum]